MDKGKIPLVQKETPKEIAFINYRPIRMDHREKIKENEKREKYLDLTRELKMSWSMKVTDYN